MSPAPLASGARTSGRFTVCAVQQPRNFAGPLGFTHAPAASMPRSFRWRNRHAVESVISPRRRVRGPGLQARVGRVPSRSATFDVAYRHKRGKSRRACRGGLRAFILLRLASITSPINGDEPGFLRLLWNRLHASRITHHGSRLSSPSRIAIAAA